MSIDMLIAFISKFSDINRNLGEEEALMYTEACRCLKALLKRARIAHEHFAEQEENENDKPETPT